jgi:hypothetical protein
MQGVTGNEGGGGGVLCRFMLHDKGKGCKERHLSCYSALSSAIECSRCLQPRVCSLRYTVKRGLERFQDACDVMQAHGE